MSAAAKVMLSLCIIMNAYGIAMVVACITAPKSICSEHIDFLRDKEMKIFWGVSW